MASEPERPIESALREAARRRREAAGGPFDLHPATRSVLQGEVSRQFPKGKREPRSMLQALVESGPKWAWGITVGSALIVFSVMFWPARRPPLQEAQFANREELAAKTATLSESPVASPRPSELPLPQIRDGAVSLQETGFVVASKDLAEAESTLKEADTAQIRTLDLARNRAPAAGATLSSSPNEQSPSAREPSLGRQITSVADSSGNPTLTKRYRLAAPANSASAQDGLLDSAKQNQTGIWSRQQFVQTGQPILPSPAKKKSGPAEIPVLASFQMEQAGNNLRLIDQDGSVYSGSVQMDNQPLVNWTGNTVPQATALGGQTRLTRVTPSTNKVAQQNDGSFAFQVSGTNISLRQQVVFNGKFLPVIPQSSFGLVTNGQAGVAGGAAGPPIPQTYNVFLNSRISGKAKIAGGKDIEIEAEPAK